MITLLVYFVFGMGIGAIAALVVKIGIITLNAIKNRIIQAHRKFVFYMQMKKFEKKFKEMVASEQAMSLSELFQPDDVLEVQHDGENFKFQKSDLSFIDSSEGIDEQIKKKLEEREFLNIAVPTAI